MIRWDLPIREKTNRFVLALLTRTGRTRGDLSAFVEAACRSEVLRRTVSDIHQQNADLSAEEASRLALEAIAHFGGNA
ncbi:MAG: hypothetical protein KDC95_18900 [Planctomycetes bacterium]|nr:hypothetical protein [Planctomycetota bacterium]